MMQERVDVDGEDEECKVMMLPDDALLEVFSRVPMKDLLWSVRCVCRRWRALAVSPELWLRAALDLRHCRQKDVVLALRVLTRLHVATLRSGAALRLARDTSCAVTDLSLFTKEGSAVHAVLLPAVQRQVALGRLKALSLLIRREHLGDLLAIIDGASVPIEKLSLHLICGAVDKPVAASPPAASSQQRSEATLKELVFRSRRERDPMLEHILETHAASLERVSLSGPASPRALELLGQCCRLQRVYANALGCAELGALLRGCPMLRTLSFSVGRNTASLAVPTELKAAINLTSLSITCPVRCSGALVLSLVSALASTASSALEDLSLHGGGVEVLSGLELALPGLPRLRSLTLGKVPPPALLAALGSRDAVPSLRVLRLESAERIRGCILTSAPELCAVVERNPLLHVLGVNAEPCCAVTSVPDPCNTSKRKYPDSGINLSGHHPAERCGVKEHCIESGVWLFIGLS